MGLLAMHAWGPAFSVKGSWEGDLEAAKTLPQGLGPKSVGGISFAEGGLSVAAEDGKLKAGYITGPLSISLDDSKAWQANFTQGYSFLRVRGTGGEDLSWEASKEGYVEGVGDAQVNISSAGDYAVELVPELPISEIAGVTLDAVTRSHGDGIYGKLEASRKLSKHAHASYSVENEEGDYDLGNLKHAAEVAATMKDGSLVVKVAKAGEVAPTYNATYSHDLGTLLQGDSAAVVGIDNGGVYGHFAKGHAVGGGVSAVYEVGGRADGDDRSFSHSATVNHDLGSLKLTHGSDKPVAAALAVATSQGPASLSGKLGYELNADAPTFNLTVSTDLAEALDKLEATGEIVVGLDDTSADGLYGKLTASRSVGDGLTVDLSSGGRMKSLAHSVKLSNKLGYAELVQAGDEGPRLKLGYQFDA